MYKKVPLSKTPFGLAIKKARIRAGISQTALCRKVNESTELEKLTQATLSAWESGRQYPSNTRHEQILLIYNILGQPQEILEEYKNAVSRGEGVPRVSVDNLQMKVENLERLVEEYKNRGMPAMVTTPLTPIYQRLDSMFNQGTPSLSADIFTDLSNLVSKYEKQLSANCNP